MSDAKTKPKHADLRDLFAKARKSADATAPRAKGSFRFAEGSRVKSLSLTKTARDDIRAIKDFGDGIYDRAISDSAAVRACLRFVVENVDLNYIVELVRLEFTTGEVVWGKRTEKEGGTPRRAKPRRKPRK